MKRTLILLAAALGLALTPASADNLSLRTVVIDAGHGGKDPGAVSPDKKSYEKNFTLDIAKRVSSKISAAYPEINVILTRSDDTFISLDKRATIANKANADLFISVHINSCGKSAPEGYSVHVLGQSHKQGSDLFAANMEICKRENAVVALDENYNPDEMGFDPNDPESYIFMAMMQNAYLEQSIQFADIVAKKLKSGPFKNNRGVSQDPFYVLWKTSMPSVLVELGYLSNSDDLYALRQSTNRDKIADCLFEAFKSYKARYDATLAVKKAEEASGSKPVIVPKPEEQAKPAQQKPAPVVVAPQEKKAEPARADTKPAVQKPAEPASDAVRYGVQVFAVSNKLAAKDSRLLGYTPVVIRREGDKLYKYILGVSISKETAKAEMKKIKEKYSDCFLVEIRGERIKRIQ